MLYINLTFPVSIQFRIPHFHICSIITINNQSNFKNCSYIGHSDVSVNNHNNIKLCKKKFSQKQTINNQSHEDHTFVIPCDQQHDHEGHVTNQMSYYSTIGSCDQKTIRFLTVQTHESHVIDTDQSAFLLQSHEDNMTNQMFPTITKVMCQSDFLLYNHRRNM